jgi:thioredoxin reductase (NADPH)
VWLLVRGAALAATMSSYLVDRIAGLSNVEVVLGTEVIGLEGRDGILDAIRLRRRVSGQEVRQRVRHLFLFIGADPNTDWPAGSGVALDPKGFILTGAEVATERKSLETSWPGVFVIGDVRSGLCQACRSRGRRRSAGRRDAPRRVGLGRPPTCAVGS